MRAIDGDALMNDINESLNQMTDIGVAVDGEWLWEKLNDAIDNAPTIERKKGKWINDERFLNYANCSECGYQMDVHAERGYFNFCPNCGADMRGDKDDA